MSAEEYIPKIHHVGPDEIDVESGGVIDIKSGGALKLAGTAITASAAAINALNGMVPVAVATFDATGTAGNRTVAAHGTGITLPANTIIVGGFIDVNTAFTSTNSTATVAISVEAANDVFTALAVSDAKLGTIGRKAIIPKANTPESTSLKTTAAREITVSVAVEALLGGKMTIYLYFVEGVASA